MKKLFAIVLSCLLIAGMFAGCGNTAAEETTAAAAETTAAAAETTGAAETETTEAAANSPLLKKAS